MKDEIGLPDRIGLQTIIYGEDFLLGLPQTLQQIRAMGFTGVEFFQTPSKLGDPHEFESLMESNGLTLLGLSGGSLQDRRDFCAQLKQPPKYIYVQDLLPETLSTALSFGCQVAVHPIQYSKLDSYKETVRRIQELPAGRPRESVTALPDSAHLYLGNESLADILKTDGSDVHYAHLKDWSPAFGTSMFTYARGFCELGQGIVMNEELRETLLKWLASSKSKWIVIEQDSSSRSPLLSSRMSLDWLRGKKPSPAWLPYPAPEEYEYRLGHAIAVLGERAPDRYVAKLLETLTRANLDCVRDSEQHYYTILKGFSNLLDLKAATIWEISPREKTASLRSVWQPLTAPKHRPAVVKMDLEKALCGLAVDKQEPVLFGDVRAVRNDGRQFAETKFIDSVRLESMVSIPINNRWNPHQPEIVVNLFPETLAEIARNGELTPRFGAALKLLKDFLGLTIERAWEQKRSELRRDLEWVAATSATVKDILNNSLAPIKKHLRCSEAEILLLDQAGAELEQVAPQLPPGERGSTANSPLALQARRERAVYNSGTKAKMDDTQPGSNLVIPLFHHGRPLRDVMGMICCHGKHSAHWNPDFTVTDELTLDAVQAALVPRLERMIAAEHRTKTMARVSHELKEPLTLFRGANRAALEEMARNNWRFSRDHLGRIRDYLNLMVQVVSKASFLKQELKNKLRLTRTLLFEDVIRPASDDLAVYLNRATFTSSALVPNDILDLPALVRQLLLGDDAFTERLRTQFSNASLVALRAWSSSEEPGTDARRLVVNGLNRIIRGDSLYDDEHCKHINLRPETVSLSQADLEGIEIWRLNRLLLEDAYPTLIARSPDYSTRSIIIDPGTSAKGGSAVAASMQTLNVKSLPPLYVDKSRFRQVFFNLLSNAIKYAQPSPYPFRVEICAQQALGGTDILIRDWGSGIPEGMKESIFCEGVRGPQWINRDVVGDGLGLFIVREILGAHECTISVSSCREPTEFTIFVPSRLSDFNQRIVSSTGSEQ